MVARFHQLREPMLKTALEHTAGAMGAWALARRLTRRVPRLFMLHRFSVAPDPRRTDREELGRFIDRLAAECECLTMRDLACRLDDPTPPSRPLAAITVDDGYADFHEVALPLLRERGIPATVYATAGFVDGRCWLWWDALRWLIDHHPAGTIVLQLQGRTFSLEINDPASRSAAWSQVADHLVTRNACRAAALDGLAASSGIPLPPSPAAEYAAMSWSQLRDCAEAGVEIGGHTMTHAFLPSLDDEALTLELGGAKALIESRLGRPVETFAYPNGMPCDWTPRVEQAVVAAGYSAAVLAHPRRFKAAERFRLGRWSASPRSRQFGHILSGASELKLALGRD